MNRPHSRLMTLWVIAAIANTIVCVSAYADNDPVGTTFTYQGRLTQQGEPVSEPANFAFRLFDAENGGTLLGELSASNFELGEDGVFTVDLDFGNHFTGAPRWLEIDVNGVTLSPRQPIMPAPYAMVATTAANVPTKAVVGHYTGITGVGTLDSLNVSGQVGIGSAAPPWAKMTVQTGASEDLTGLYVHSANTTNANAGIMSIVEAPGSTGIQAWSTSSSSGIGMFARADGTNGIGVIGRADHTSGLNWGGAFLTNSTSGIGVQGSATAASGVTRAVWGEVSSPDGYAAYFTGPAGSRNYFQRNVGIGTTAPRQHLSIGGNLDLYSGSANSPTRPSIRGSSANNIVISAIDGGATFINHDGGTGGVRFHDGTPGASGEVARITSDGRLGLGLTNPGARLSVQASSSGEHLLQAYHSDGFIRLNVNSNGNIGMGLVATPNSQLHINGTSGTNPLRVQVSGLTRLLVHDNGNVMVGSTSTPQDTLHVAGTTRTNVIRIMGGSDLSERFDVAELDELTPQPGMVVCIDPHNPGKLIPSTSAYDRTVAGVISGANGINSGMIMGQEGTEADGEFPVALTGRVYVLADATGRAIKPGDLLTTSDVPGYAKRVTDFQRAQGAIIGKAMTSLVEGERGLVLVLVSLQ